MMYDQKDIVLIPFPYSDLTGSKQRPALIISNSLINKTEDRICCLITSQQPQDGILLAENFFEKGKLPFKSWVKPHRLFTIHEKIIKKRLCTVSSNFHDRIATRISEYLRRD
ncbi:MAG: type II toxin-antitoxin system PemK/MazF family toxin [Nanoarchaeota archaeon]